MKRSGPPKRKTPLKPGNKGLKRTGPLRNASAQGGTGPTGSPKPSASRSGRIRQRSDKTAARDRLYNAVRERFMAGKRCELGWEGCKGEAHQCDHIVNRSLAPELVVDPRNFQALCWSCHDLKTNDPGRARAAGVYGRELIPGIKAAPMPPGYEDLLPDLYLTL